MANLFELAYVPIRYRLWSPYHWSLVWRDMRFTSPATEQSDREHLTAAIDWLCRAQDVVIGGRPDGGVSAGWSYEDGWLPSYPETSGYIIETFLAAADLLNDESLKERAHRILDWELGLQLDDGSFPGHFGEAGSKPVIFNTGQIMHGMVAGYRELNRTECLDAAAKAAHWMVSGQDDDGCWRRNVHNGIPHTYNTRAAWALARVGNAANDQTFLDAARKNCEWALGQQNDRGWYASNAFENGKQPFTHTIAYAIRGLLETGYELGDERFVESAVKAGIGIANAQRDDGWLGGTYDEHWRTSDTYTCLTGIAQLCIAWIRMAEATGSEIVADAAERGLAFLKLHHRTSVASAIEAGGVAGSFPIWGDYSRFEYPNWAAKFFADALMMQANPANPVPKPTAR